MLGYRPGDVIVSPMMHPAWLPEMLQATAVISDLGGWLSHMAIVAREHGVPMIVGVSGLSLIPAGCLLRIESDGRIVELAEPPEPAREDVLIAAQ